MGEIRNQNPLAHEHKLYFIQYNCKKSIQYSWFSWWWRKAELVKAGRTAEYIFVLRLLLKFRREAKNVQNVFWRQEWSYEDRKWCPWKQVSWGKSNLCARLTVFVTTGGKILAAALLRQSEPRFVLLLSSRGYYVICFPDVLFFSLSSK